MDFLRIVLTILMTLNFSFTYSSTVTTHSEIAPRLPKESLAQQAEDIKVSCYLRHRPESTCLYTNNEESPYNDKNSDIDNSRLIASGSLKSVFTEEESLKNIFNQCIVLKKNCCSRSKSLFVKYYEDESKEEYIVIALLQEKTVPESQQPLKIYCYTGYKATERGILPKETYEEIISMRQMQGALANAILRIAPIIKFKLKAVNESHAK